MPNLAYAMTALVIIFMHAGALAAPLHYTTPAPPSVEQADDVRLDLVDFAALPRSSVHSLVQSGASLLDYVSSFFRSLIAFGPVPLVISPFPRPFANVSGPVPVQPGALSVV